MSTTRSQSQLGDMDVHLVPTMTMNAFSEPLSFNMEIYLDIVLKLFESVISTSSDGCGVNNVSTTWIDRLGGKGGGWKSIVVRTIHHNRCGCPSAIKIVEAIKSRWNAT
jgi:hypothetical protein